jgi:hypothetical protein
MPKIAHYGGKLKNFFNRNPWVIYALLAVITIPLCIWGLYSIWYNYYDVTYITGKVESFSWQMDVDEYHLITEEKGDWADEIEEGNYDVECYDAWRPVKETLENGNVVEYEIEDKYCEYKVDSWDYHDTISNTGTDKNPFYLPYPADTKKIKYEEQPGTFTVYFTSDTTGTISFNYDRATWDAFRAGMRVQIGISRQGTTPYPPKLPQ